KRAKKEATKEKARQLTSAEVAPTAVQIEGWGKPVIQSYVEDLTARTALKIKHVGSGMRAAILASKMEMLVGEQTEQASFKKTMYDAFPQLLTGTKKKGTDDDKGGAALYNKKITAEYDEKRPAAQTKTQTELFSKVEEQHARVRVAIGKRFDQKYAQVASGELTLERAGNWWETTFGGDGTDQERLAAVTDGQTALRSQYIGWKMQRHDIDV
ncbi:MAG TPA: hypothetical protein VJS66_05150, partial [Burkholderiales bacterium]|nr:hypothetical protein [Burkholderiales bacterium]